MKIECVEKVGDIQKQKIYTFDAEKLADIRLVRDLLYLTESVPLGGDLMKDDSNANDE